MQPPLIEIGNVSREVVGAAVAAVLVFSLVFFRGGMLLIGAAEDLDGMVAKEPAGQLESALSRTRRYFILEVLGFAALAAVAYLAVFGIPR